MFGELIPLGGGDPIPLLKSTLLCGRRESCDIILRFANVSAHHCQLMMSEGYWYVRDLQSRNGVRINNIRVSEKRLDPGDVLSIATHRYEIKYSPVDLGAVGPPPSEGLKEDILAKSLLERSGLVKQVQHINDGTRSRRFDPTNMAPGQINITKNLKGD